jgi:RNA-directed DNA polymerase
MASDLLKFFDEIDWDALDQPLPAEGHFAAAYLAELFRSKIARSQATGKDGTRIARFSEKLGDETQLIERKVLSDTYHFTTFKERLILRGAYREPRQISIPTVRDRLTLRALCQVLHTYVPKSVGPSPHSLVREVVSAIRGDNQHQSFVRIDVKNFFPAILHHRLEKELSHHGIDERMRQLCINAIKTPTGEKSSPNERGVPQGLSISGALASAFMLRFDILHQKRIRHFFRYVDDILIICPTSHAKSELKFVSSSLSRRGLKAHALGTEGKTEIRPISEGIDFLGYHISIGQVSIRKSSFQRMFKNVLKVITDYRYRRDADRTLFRLNLKISGCQVDGKRLGWMMFFSLTEDMNQLQFLDRFVKQQLRRVGFPTDRINEAKRFIKSYHEIRFNLAGSSYIPNLDTFTQDEKVAVITTLTGRAAEEVMAWNIENIDDEFNRLISKEIQGLEQDVGSPS